MKCSFSGFSACHQRAFTRKKKVKPVASHLLDTLERRSGLKAKFIKAICPHHEHELLLKFKKTKSVSRAMTKCANPFNRPHRKGKAPKCRPVTETFIEKYKLQGILNTKEALCNVCRKLISKPDQLVEKSETNLKGPDDTGSDTVVGVSGTSGEADDASGVAGSSAGEGTSRQEAAASSTSTSSPGARSDTSEHSPQKALQAEQLADIMEKLGETPVRKRK